MWAEVYGPCLRTESATAPSQFRGLKPPHQLSLALADLPPEFLDDLRHGLAHPRQLPVLDLDDAEARGGGHRGGALLLLQQALLPEDVARSEVGDVLSAPLDLHRAVLD